MKRTRSCITRYVVMALLLSSSSRADLAHPQNFSGLLNKELTKDPASVLVLEDVFLSRRRGRITSAKVLDDSERSLIVEVAYQDADLTKPKNLSVEVYGENSRQQRIDVPITKLTAPSGRVQVTATLDKHAPEGQTLQSKSLVIRIRDEAGSSLKYDTSAAFVLAKKWSVDIAPENVVVAVIPTPMGSIPGADPTAAAPTPPRPMIFRPEVRSMVVRPAMVQPRAAVAQPMVIQPAATRNVVRTVVPGTARTDLPIMAVRRLPDLTVVQGLPPKVTDKGGKGPSDNILPLFATLITAPGTSLTGAKITSISGDLYRDVNQESGIFYYLPAAYTLYWDADNRYQLRMLYGASSSDDVAGNVTISARLTSSLDASEVDLLRKLLKAALGNTFKELQPFPFDGPPTFSLKDDVKAFNIPAEKVSVAAISDIAGEVDVSITTDTVTKENIQATLTRGLGLSGTATFTSASAPGAAGFSRSIPVRLRLTDPRSFGTKYWRRSARLRNDSYFPWNLKYVHFLTIGSDGTPTVYSYDLQGTEVPPGAQAEIADTPVQTWLDHALKAWIEFSVKDNYEAGIKQAIRDCTGGVDAMSTASLSVSSLTPFSDAGGIARLLVDVRSKYYDPQGTSEQTRTVTLNKNDETVSIGPLFLINRTTDEVARDGDPLFTYRFSVVKEDGQVAGPSAWKTGERMTLFVGSSQVAEVFPHP